jgi:hypothetical protein
MAERFMFKLKRMFKDTRPQRFAQRCGRAPARG